MSKRKRHLVVALSGGPFATLSGRYDILSVLANQSLRIRIKDDLISVVIESDDGTEPLEYALTRPLMLRCDNLELMTLKALKKRNKI